MIAQVDFQIMPLSETGRIQFRRVRLQTTNSVRFCCPHRALGRELSEFLSAYYLCHQVSRRTHRVCPKTQWGAASSLLRSSALETVFRPFPKRGGFYEITIICDRPYLFLRKEFSETFKVQMSSLSGLWPLRSRPDLQSLWDRRLKGISHCGAYKKMPTVALLTWR